MHPHTMYELVNLRIAEEQRWAARQRLAHEAREARFAGRTDESLLERLVRVLRHAVRPASTAPTGAA